MENILFYPHIHWTSYKKFLLRFGILYFFIPILPVPFYIDDHLYPWIASTIFSIPEISPKIFGSGDMYCDYMRLFMYFVIAIVGSVIWSFFNKKDKTYDTLLHYFLIFMRYYLVSNMLIYGFSKVFYNQFLAPDLHRLLETYGESSPMGIAWTFMGASKAYTVFSGIAELLGAVLLLSRRTTLAGALVSFAVMVNVVMLNFCYDIPVKLYATQLMIVALIIVCCNGHALWNALWTHKAMEATTYKPLFTKKWLKITRIIVKSLVVFYLVGIGGYNQYQTVAKVGPDVPKTPLYGIYKPTQLIKNNDTLGLYSYPTQWKTLIVDYPGYATVKQVNDEQFDVVFNVDTIKKKISVQLQTDSIHNYELAYKQLNDTTLNLKGVLSNNQIDFTFHKVNMKSFTLTNRGFHWVSEYAYNK